MSETNGTISLRNSRIGELHQELKAIPIIKDQGEMVYAIGRNINILRKLVDELEDRRKELFAAHFGSAGEVVREGDPRIPGYNTAFKDMQDMKVELTPHKFEVANLKKADLSPSSFAAALVLIEP